MILNAIYGQRIALRFRVAVSLTTVILLFATVSVLAKVDSDDWQTTFMYVTLALVAIINVNTATYQSGVFGVAGKFPYRFALLTIDFSH